MFVLCISNISGTSIKCYDCNSNLDVRCALPYPPTEYVVNCDEVSAKTNLTYIFCRNISQIIKIGINSCKFHFDLLSDFGAKVQNSL